MTTRRSAKRWATRQLSCYEKSWLCSQVTYGFDVNKFILLRLVPCLWYFHGPTIALNIYSLRTIFVLVLKISCDNCVWSNNHRKKAQHDNIPVTNKVDRKGRLSDFVKGNIFAHCIGHQNKARIIDSWLTYFHPYTTLSNFLKWYFACNRYHSAPTISSRLKMSHQLRHKSLCQLITAQHQTIWQIQAAIAHNVLLRTIKWSLWLLGIQK